MLIAVSLYKFRPIFSIFYRCFANWRDISSFRAAHRKKMQTFRTKHLLTKVWHGITIWSNMIPQHFNHIWIFQFVFQMFNEWLLRYEDVRTARIILGVKNFIFTIMVFSKSSSFIEAKTFCVQVSEERKTDRIFKAWHAWATGSLSRLNSEHYMKY